MGTVSDALDLSSVRCPDCGKTGELYFWTDGTRVEASCTCGGGFASQGDDDMVRAVRAVMPRSGAHTLLARGVTAVCDYLYSPAEIGRFKTPIETQRDLTELTRWLRDARSFLERIPK